MAEDSARTTSRGAAFRVAALGLPLLLCFGLPELVLRWLDPPLHRFTAIRFGGEESSTELFVTDPTLHWKLRADVEVEFLATKVRTNTRAHRGPERRPGVREVLVLGDSTPFGWRVSEGEAFPGALAKALGEGWQVSNAGVPGYTSMQSRLAAEREIAELAPAVVVLCVGNNESWRGAASDRQLHEASARGRALERWLRKSRLASWIGEQLRPEAPPVFDPGVGLGDVPRVSLAEFRDNLAAIAALARDRGARLLLVEPPVSPYRPPWNLGNAGGWAEWGTWFSATGERIDAGDVAGALESIRERRAIEAEAFFPMWLEGYALARSGSLAAGRELLEAAIERYPGAVRARRSYREALADFAETEGLALFATNADFHAQVPGEIPEAYYLDHAHPTALGHARIASWLAEAIGRDESLRR